MFAYLLNNKTTEYRMLLRLTTIDIILINALFYVLGLNKLVKVHLILVFLKLLNFQRLRQSVFPLSILTYTSIS